MATDLKLGEIPGGIFVGWALYMSERSLVRGKITVDVEGYLNFTPPSALRLNGSSGIYTYTSRTRVSDANPLVLQSLCTAESSVSKTLE